MEIKTPQQSRVAETLITGKAAPKLFENVSIEHGRIPADLCERGRYQPRRNFSGQELQDLADSIKQTGGNIQPVILRPRGDGCYEILAGERRVRATILAGFDYVLAIYGDFSDEQCHIITIVENLQREDLDPIEEASGFQTLLDKGMKQHEVAASVGKRRVVIANAVRLLKLDIVVKDYLKSRKLSAGHGKAIAGLKSDAKQQQRELARKAVKLSWSVRRLEAEVQKFNEPLKKVVMPRSKDANLQKLSELVSGKFGAPVSVRPSTKVPNAGFVHIAYFSEKELRIVLEKMDAWPNEKDWE